jgi:predicted component of type VI protein secretion system
LFTEDKWLSPKHANFYYSDGSLFVTDENSENGVFICLKGSTNVTSGMIVMAGEQFFRVEEVEEVDESPDSDGTYYFASPRRESAFRLVQILEGGGDGMVVHARDNQVLVGREGCDMNFPNDPYMSGTHFKIEAKKGVLVLDDLGSKNGTYLRITDKQQLGHGDYIFLGRQLLRVEITT